jgi:hypothetical protein
VCLLVCALMQFILLFPSSGAALSFTLGTDIRGFGLCHFLEFVECSDGACFYPSKSLKSKSLLTYIDTGGWWVVAGTEATSWRKITTFSSCYFAGFFSSLLLALCACICVCVVTRLTNVRKVSQSLEFLNLFPLMISETKK